MGCRPGWNAGNSVDQAARYQAFANNGSIARFAMLHLPDNACAGAIRYCHRAPVGPLYP